MVEFLIMIQRLTAPVVCWGLAVLIHEAGHVLAGSVAGRKPVRVLIGLEGRLHGVFTVFGIPIVLRGGPWSGFVFFGSFGSRFQTIWIALAGPLAGMAAALAVVALDHAWAGPGFSLAKAKPVIIWQTWFVLTNLWVALASLWPCLRITKNHGMLASDGLLVARQFRPDWIPSVRRKEDGASMILITVTFMAGIGCMVASALMGVVAWSDFHGRMKWVMPALMVFFLGLAVLTVSMAGRELRLNRRAKRRAAAANPGGLMEPPTDPHPVENSVELPAIPPTDRADDLKKVVAAFEAKDWPTVQALINHHRAAAPLDTVWLSLGLHYLMGIEDYTAALALCGEIPDGLSESEVIRQAAVAKVQCLSALGLKEEAGNAVETLTSRFSDETAIRLLDMIATQALIRNDSAVCAACLPLLRRFCQENEKLISLCGTLGGILAELGHLDEARPILLEVMKKSESMADLGITSLILAEIASRTGRTAEAVGLARRALVLYDEAWVSTRARTLLSQLLP